MTKPMIGIMPLVDVEKESYWMLPGYMKGIEAAGGIPVMLPLITDEKDIKQLVHMCHGFLFTGGQDVSPAVYGEEVSEKCGEPCNQRDQMEKILFHMAMQEDKPILGICRGIQIINALTGGTLYQDLPTEYPSTTQHQQKPPYDQPSHEVSLIPDSPLHKLLNKEKIMVNSCHHQAIKTLGENTTVMAISEDGLVEAISIPDKKFIWAFQWHPEFSYKNNMDSQKIFKVFLESTKG